LALAYQKHPVEFSKNNHTPTPTHTRADTGATTQTYPTSFASVKFAFIRESMTHHSVDSTRRRDRSVSPRTATLTSIGFLRKYFSEPIQNLTRPALRLQIGR
jgi:hypothetical protein